MIYSMTIFVYILVPYHCTYTYIFYLIFYIFGKYFHILGGWIRIHVPKADWIMQDPSGKTDLDPYGSEVL